MDFQPTREAASFRFEVQLTPTETQFSAYPHTDRVLFAQVLEHPLLRLSAAAAMQTIWMKYCLFWSKALRMTFKKLNT